MDLRLQLLQRGITRQDTRLQDILDEILNLRRHFIEVLHEEREFIVRFLRQTVGVIASLDPLHCAYKLEDRPVYVPVQSGRSGDTG
ncbi:hypothetical protein A3842_21795 [Paenibacillus sp. P3E]|nr:hypothetical protein A3842_21795 [Paenibacillus sp. P3E]